MTETMTIEQVADALKIVDMDAIRRDLELVDVMELIRNAIAALAKRLEALEAKS